MPFYEALETVKSFARPLATERVDLSSALGRILAEDVISDLAMPPFNKSAMDGYACRKSDIKNVLQVVAEIAAGSVPSSPIGENQCARIMTGAVVPDGADLVIMKEEVELVSATEIRFTGEGSKTNICYKGEDVRSGDHVLEKEILIGPQHVAILASVGCVLPLVFKRPSVAIISTGNELVEPTEMPGISQIRNSNGYQLMAQIRQMGINPDYLGIVADNEDALRNMLTRAIENYDLTLVSGGVSVGDFDFVPKILRQLNVNIRIHGLNARPGKHQLFAENGNHFVFGMPGNPVSSFVQFEILVKPFLNALTGKLVDDPLPYLPIEEDYRRKNSEQLLFVPVRLTQHGTVVPLEYHGSAHIHAYAKAFGIMEVPMGILTLKKGEPVCVRPL